MVQTTDKDRVQPTNATVGVNKLPATGLRKQLLILVLLLGIGVLGGVGYYFYRPAPTAKKQPVARTATTAPQTTDQTAANYQAQEQALQNQLASDKDTSSKLLTYSQQSTLAVQDKQYTDAQKYAAAAMQADPSSPTPYADLAEIAQAQGNIAAAKQYWQEAINHVTSDMPGYNIIKQDYQNNLDSLQ